MTIYMEHADGYSWETGAESLEEAQRVVENEAVCAYENCSEEDIPTVFPMYWSIKGEDGEIAASGYVNEQGEMYS